jgi:WD40 repeat protein
MRRRLALVMLFALLGSALRAAEGDILAGGGPSAALGQAADGLSALKSYRFRLSIRIERSEPGVPTQIAELINLGEIVAPNRYHGRCLASIGPIEAREEVIAIGRDTFVKDAETGDTFEEKAPDVCDTNLSPAQFLEQLPLDSLAFAALIAGIEPADEQVNGVEAQRYNLGAAVTREQVYELARSLYGNLTSGLPLRDLSPDAGLVFDIWLANDGGWPAALLFELTFANDGRDYLLRFSLGISDANSPAITITDPTAPPEPPANLAVITPQNAGRVGAARVLRGHNSAVFAVAISRDGRLLASASNDRTAKLWDPTTGAELRTLRGHNGAVNSVAFSPDGKLLATVSDDRTVRLWDTVGDERPRVLTGHSDWIWSVAFSPDGKLLASGSEDGTVRIWDVASGGLLRSLAHGAAVNTVAFAPDGVLIASGGDDMRVKLWDAATGELARTLSGHRQLVVSVSFSPDGRSLASAAGDRTARLWEVASGAPIRTVVQGQPANTVTFSPDGALLATGGDEFSVKLWDIAAGREAQTLRGHRARVNNAIFSPDGRLLISAGGDRSIRIWAVVK